MQIDSCLHNSKTLMGHFIEIEKFDESSFALWGHKLLELRFLFQLCSISIFTLVSNDADTTGALLIFLKILLVLIAFFFRKARQKTKTNKSRRWCL